MAELSKEVKLYAYEVSFTGTADGYVEAKTDTQAKEWIRDTLSSGDYDEHELTINVYEQPKELRNRVHIDIEYEDE